MLKPACFQEKFIYGFCQVFFINYFKFFHVLIKKYFDKNVANP